MFPGSEWLNAEIEDDKVPVMSQCEFQRVMAALLLAAKNDTGQHRLKNNIAIL